MAGPTSEFLALFLEASGKKETPISANSQKDMRDMNCLLPNKASCLFRKYFKRDGQAYPLTASFSHHCRGRFLYGSAQTTFLYRRLTAGYAGLHLLTATAGAAWCDFIVMWTGLTVSRRTPQLIHGAKGAGVLTYTQLATQMPVPWSGSGRSRPGRGGPKERLTKDSLSHPCYLYISTLVPQQHRKQCWHTEGSREFLRNGLFKTLNSRDSSRPSEAAACFSSCSRLWLSTPDYELQRPTELLLHRHQVAPLSKRRKQL